MSEEINVSKKGDLWECKIDGHDFAFRQWTWGEKNRAVSDCTRIGSESQAVFDTSEFNIRLLLQTLKKAPFAISRDALINYPNSRTVDKALQITSKLNLVGNVEIKNL